MSLKSTLDSVQAQIESLVEQQFVDIASWCGLLTYTHSQISSAILETIEKERTESLPKDEPSLAQLLLHLWSHVHLKTIRYFHLQFHQLKTAQIAQVNVKSEEDDARKPGSVNYRTFYTIFNKFLKVNKLMIDFYHDIAQSVLTQYDCSEFIPSPIYQHFRAKPDENLPKVHSTFNTRFIFHRILFFEGTLSRYRTLFYMYRLSLSVKVLENGEMDPHKQRHFPDFSKALHYLQLAHTVLPGLGDPLGHIGMIMNTYGELKQENIKKALYYLNNPGRRFFLANKFEAAYYFTLSAHMRIEPRIQSNLDLMQLLLDPDFLTHFNMVMKAALRYESRGGLKKPKSKTLESKFKLNTLALTGYYLMGEDLFGGMLVLKGGSIMDIRNYFLESIAGIDSNPRNQTILMQLFAILAGAYKTLQDAQKTAKAREVLSLMLEFAAKVFDVAVLTHKRYTVKTAKLSESIVHLLPLIRTILNWTRLSRSVLEEVRRNLRFVVKLAYLINQCVRDQSPEKSLFAHREPRACNFMEDVEFAEFVPFGSRFKDFDDELMGKSRYSALRLSGILPEKTLGSSAVKERLEVSTNEDQLRVYALGWLGKRIIYGHHFAIATNENGEYDLSSYNKELIDKECESVSNSSSSGKNSDSVHTKRPSKKEWQQSTRNESHFDDEQGFEKPLKPRLYNKVSKNSLRKATGSVKPANKVMHPTFDVPESDTDTDSDSDEENVVFKASDDVELNIPIPSISSSNRASANVYPNAVSWSNARATRALLAQELESRLLEQHQAAWHYAPFGISGYSQRP